MNINNKYARMIFRNEDDGGGSGGASLAATLLPPVGGEPKDPNDGADDEPSGSSVDLEGGAAPVKPAAGPQQVTLDPTSFAAAIKAAGLGQQAPAAPITEPNKPLTPEQIAGIEDIAGRYVKNAQRYQQTLKKIA